VCSGLLGAWSHASGTESQSMLMQINPAILLADAPDLPGALGIIESNSTDRAVITALVGEQAAKVWGAGFDIIREDFLHSHLRVYFEVEKSMMSEKTKVALSHTQTACRGAHGKKILVAGLPRAASTSLFELVQILLYFCDEYYKPYKQTLYSTYFVDDPDFTWRPFNKVGESAVVKSHTAGKDTGANWGDMVFTSHREPSSMLRSQWLSFHGKENSCPDHEPLPCEDWSNCQREMERQACFYAIFPPDKLKYDMSTEALYNSPQRVIREVALSLGFPQSENSELTAMLDHVYSMYTEVQKKIQTEAQVSHGDSEKWSAVADRDVQSRTFQYTTLLNVHGKPKTLGCRGWSAGGGSIASNPLMAQPGKMADIRDEVTWEWCKA